MSPRHEHDWRMPHDSFLRDHRTLHPTNHQVTALVCDCGAQALHVVHETEPARWFYGLTLDDLPKVAAAVGTDSGRPP